jgi:hypothetical protein
LWSGIQAYCLVWAVCKRCDKIWFELHLQFQY